MNWADFTDQSNSQTISGINPQISLQFTVSAITGNPTYGYRINGGAWNYFTAATAPVTAANLVAGTTVEFMVMGSAAESGTITVTNTSDANTVLDVITATVGSSLPAGAFVLSSSAYTGNLGGMSGADTICYNEIINNNWKNKASFGIIPPELVSAWLCGSSTTCQPLLEGVSYKFAKAGSPATGGGVIVAGSGGAGPNDASDWSTATAFGAAETYWTGRNTGTTTAWGAGVSSCSTFTSTSSTSRNGQSNATNSARWNSSTPNCTSSLKLICAVNPYAAAPAKVVVTASVPSTTFNVSTPAGYSAGDLWVIAFLGASGFTGVTSPPAGWTMVGSAGPGAGARKIEVWAKTLVTGEPATHTFTVNSTNAIYYNIPLVGNGPLTVTSSTSFVNPGATASMDLPAITTTAPGERVFAIYDSNTTAAAPAGYFTHGSGTLFGVGHGLYSKGFPTVQSTGVISSVTSTTDSVGFAFGVRYTAPTYDATPDAVDWINFNDTSSPITITGINMPINLELSVSNTSGTADYYYRKNGGAWTLVTAGTPAAINGVVSGDTLELQVLGDTGNAGTFTLKNYSDNGATLDTAVGTASVTSDKTPNAVDWVNFTTVSSTQTLSGFVRRLTLQISAANTVGTPTYSYSLNGGAWTAFTTGTPATLTGVASGDNLKFMVSGTVTHAGTITIKNVTDSNATLDTTTGTKGGCIGTSWGGYCFYMGPTNGESCDTVCANVGGTCDLTGTQTYSGTATDCNNLLLALGVNAPGGISQNIAHACATDGSSHINTTLGIAATTCAASNASVRRACACN
jgi:hypothetical protein